MKKQTFLLYYLILTQVHVSYCMLSAWKLRPCTQRESSKAFQKRKLPEKELLVSNKTFYKLQKEEELGDNYRCFQHAIAHITGFRKSNNPRYSFLKLHFNPGNNFYTSINVEKYFEQTRFPQKNDLVIYTASKKDLTIKHFGIVVSKTRVESKWGGYPFIVRHRLFDVFDGYGTAAGFFTLKKEYKDDKKLLLQSIESDSMAYYWKRYVLVSCLRELAIHCMRINPHMCQ
jgi:hypothetical protein